MTFRPRGFNGFCATQNSREIEVAQKPLNHRREVGGEKSQPHREDSVWREVRLSEQPDFETVDGVPHRRVRVLLLRELACPKESGRREISCQCRMSIS